MFKKTFSFLALLLVCFSNLVSSPKASRSQVKLTFHSIRVKEELCGKVAQVIETDSASIMKLISDRTWTAQYGYTPDNILCTFIPNTYHMYKDYTAQEFMDRMFAENRKFWTAERLSKAAALGLTTKEAYIMASIVEKETTVNAEKSKIAGVFVNRIRKGMKLQATPTVVFAQKSWSKTDFTDSDFAYKSPYNTYQVKGLPPGPICTPSIITIDAVLNAGAHNYLYFCARGDETGEHNFALDYKKHQANLTLYQNNRKAIKNGVTKKKEEPLPVTLYRKD